MQLHECILYIFISFSFHGYWVLEVINGHLNSVHGGAVQVRDELSTWLFKVRNYFKTADSRLCTKNRWLLAGCYWRKYWNTDFEKFEVLIVFLGVAGLGVPWGCRWILFYPLSGWVQTSCSSLHSYISGHHWIRPPKLNGRIYEK